MFGLGMMEIGLIIVIAVMLFPPKELPKLVRSLARIYGQVRRTAEDFRNTVLEDEDLRQPIDEIKGAYNDARWEVRDAERKARQQLAKAQMDMRMATARRLQAEREAQAQSGAQAGSQAEGPSEAQRPAEAGGKPAARAPSAGPVRIAASNGTEGDDEAANDDEPADRPVAGTDPRVISRRPTPVTSEAATGDEPREGVG